MGSKMLLVAAASAVVGAIMAAIPLVAVLILNSCDGEDRPAPSKYTPCWKPLLEIDDYGFPFLQQHVASFLQDAGDSTLVMNSLPSMSRAPPPSYDYATEVHEVIKKMATISSQGQKDEVAFFDSKLDVALSMIGTLLLGYGQSIEEIVLHSFGETSAVYDAGVAVWKSKLSNSRIRPTSVVQSMYPEEVFTINDGVEVLGKHFQALVRVMPHSEYPSGSSCMCQAIEEYVTDMWPALSLHSGGSQSPFEAGQTLVVLPNSAMPNVPLTGKPNPTAAGYTVRALNARCGETRLEGGMHFAAAVPAGKELCSGMGSLAARVTKALVPMPAAGEGTLRSVINATPPCNEMCCAGSDACGQEEQTACQSNCTDTWSLPWFDVVDARVRAFGLPNRQVATSSAAPFFQVDRNHLVIVGTFGAVVPAILRHETIFQLRLTNTVDNLVWNSIAANSATLKALKFGLGHEGMEPTIRSGVGTTDARVATGVHAVAAALPLLLPSSVSDFRQSLGFAILSPTIGIDESLAGQCGSLVEATALNAGCLSSWYAADPGPARLGQTIAYELMYQKVRDGWNSIGVDGGCSAGDHFCLRYADSHGWDPESGACLQEELTAN